MKISAKGRYALAAMVSMAQDYGSGELVTVISISQKLGISKIYLEQAFSLLKRAGLVNALKGAQGGYMLSRRPGQITAYDVLTAIEVSLFQPAGETVSEKAPGLDAAMHALVFERLDAAAKSALASVTLEDLLEEAQKQGSEGLMFFI